MGSNERHHTFCHVLDMTLCQAGMNPDEHRPVTEKSGVRQITHNPSGGRSKSRLVRQAACEKRAGFDSLGLEVFAEFSARERQIPPKHHGEGVIGVDIPGLFRRNTDHISNRG